jgi:hypothetical protein
MRSLAKLWLPFAVLEVIKVAAFFVLICSGLYIYADNPVYFLILLMGAGGMANVALELFAWRDPLNVKKYCTALLCAKIPALIAGAFAIDPLTTLFGYQSEAWYDLSLKTTIVSLVIDALIALLCLIKILAKKGEAQ